MYADFESLEDEKITMFSKKYPFLSFKHLILMDSNVMTDDGCTRYKHFLTRQVFTWNVLKNKWV
jgi:hypothetical protein